MFPWSSYVGFDTKGLFTGALLLSLLWLTYNMYLGPLGSLNNSPVYLNYKDLWFKVFLGSLCIIINWNIYRKAIYAIGEETIMIYRIVLTLLLMMFAVQGVGFAESSGSPASAGTSGEGIIVTGSNPYNFESKKPINGMISINVNNLGDRGSPLQNIDEVTVKAKFSTSDSDYEVSITEPMINHINGRDPTWFGVSYNPKMHGNTKTGTNKLPEIEPDIAIWRWAEVSKNGKLIHTRVPVHVKVMKETPLKGISLEISTQEQTLFNTPDWIPTRSLV